MSLGITKAFLLEDPSVELRWGLHEKSFRALFKQSALTQITVGHLKLRCRLLGGLESEVHFHFTPRQDGRFNQVELYRSPKRHRQKGFDDWQVRLTTLLGPPGEEHRSQWLLDIRYCWQVGAIRVMHEWSYRSGEHERILFTCEKL